MARDGGQRGHRPQGPRGEGRGGGRDGPPQEPRGVGRPRGAGRALGPRPPAVSPCASCTALAATPGRWHCRQAAPGGGQVHSVPHPGPKGPVGQHLPNTRTNSCNRDPGGGCVQPPPRPPTSHGLQGRADCYPEGQWLVTSCGGSPGTELVTRTHRPGRAGRSWGSGTESSRPLARKPAPPRV